MFQFLGFSVSSKVGRFPLKKMLRNGEKSHLSSERNLASGPQAFETTAV